MNTSQLLPPDDDELEDELLEEELLDEELLDVELVELELVEPFELLELDEDEQP